MHAGGRKSKIAAPLTLGRCDGQIQVTKGVRRRCIPSKHNPINSLCIASLSTRAAGGRFWRTATGGGSSPNLLGEKVARIFFHHCVRSVQKILGFITPSNIRPCTLEWSQDIGNPPATVVI